MQKKGEYIEVKVRKRAQRHAVRDAVLAAAYMAVAGGAIIMVPNAARLLKYVEKSIGPTPRLKQRVSQKYSQLVAQGVFKRTLRNGKLTIELTKKGENLAEEVARKDELRPRKQRQWDGKWRIIMFDIWERRRKVRDELRRILEDVGFIKVQDSVWAYPYPCEKLLVFLRTSLKLGPSVLYLVAEEVEHDEKLRKHFGLPAQIP